MSRIKEPVPMSIRQRLAFTAKVEKLLADPDVSGDLLLLAIVLARLELTEAEGLKFGRVRELLGWPIHRLRTTLYADAPRYTAETSQFHRCTAAMIRREGVCGKRSISRSFHFRDPDTGEAVVRGACTRHVPVMEKDYQANHAAWQEAGAPTPELNTGGVLPRYFHADWAETFRWAGARIPDGPLGQVAPSMPALRVVATDDPEVTEPTRGHLSPVPTQENAR